MRDSKQIRTLQIWLKTRSVPDSPDKYIEGYFAVFNQETELYPGIFEQIAPEAFTNTLERNINALDNHNTSLPLGSTRAGTLELKTDNHGLWGRVKINPEDSNALNLYARIQRGDIDQCSFGFEIVKEDADWRDDGTVKFTIREVKLYEVSPCTFAAYEETEIYAARQAQVEEHRQRLLNARKFKLKERLKNA